MFAIQWALIVCNVISCLPGIPAYIYGVKSEKFHAAVERFFETMPLEVDQPIIKLLFKFLFIGLAGIYFLGIFAGIYAPAVWVGYAFAIGNLMRVGFIGVKYLDAEKWAYGAYSAKQIGIICAIQLTLGLIIGGCTLMSSMDDEYQAFAAEMAESAAAKWETDGVYCKTIFGAAIFFTVFQIPPVLMPTFALTQFQPVEEKQPKDKGSLAVVDFVFAFQALSILMTQALVAVFVWFMPSVDGIAMWCMIFYTLYYPIYVFCPVLLTADEYGMDRLPMMIFLIMNVFLGGMSCLALFG
jgi:hypothetical protein